VDIGYGNNQLSFTITGSAGGAAFLTPAAAMNDGREGIACSMSWIGGSQTTSSYVEIDVTVSSPLDATAVLGVVGIAAIEGLPLGTVMQVLDSSATLLATQNVANGVGGQLCAWMLPFSTGNSFKIRIFNNVSGSSPITAGQTFGIGEIFVGRVIRLPTLVAPSSGSQPTADVQDSTAWSRSSGGQTYQLMRKPQQIVSGQLGLFSTSDVNSDAMSTIKSGSGSGVISLKTLRDFLATTELCAVCDLPSAGFGSGTKSNGIIYDQDTMQQNWICARPMQIGQIVQDNNPLWSWNPVFQRAI
jgi:hypothetical protein